LLLGEQILFPQQCFQRWANRETFEELETSRITNVMMMVVTMVFVDDSGDDDDENGGK
jgi:hypothetical protein